MSFRSIRMERKICYSVLCFLFGALFDKCVGSEVKLTATPGTITNGLTDTLKVRCSLQDTTDASSVVVGRQVSSTTFDIEHVNSIIISRVNPDETVTSLAEIITSENAKVVGDQQNVTVLGTLTPIDPADPEYLELTWTDPGEEQSGSYICEVNSLDPEGHGVMLQKSMAVNSADPEVKDLVNELINLKETLTSQIQDLTKENNELKAIVATHKAPHTEGGIVYCRDSDSWPLLSTGTKQLEVNVTFEQPYLSPPAISVASVGGDIDSSTNERYQWLVRDVTTTGFKILCRTWSGTHFLGMDIGWTSFVA